MEGLNVAARSLRAGESSWEHPFDEDYRDLAARMRGVVGAAGGAPPPKETDVLEMAGYLAGLGSRVLGSVFRV